MFASAERSLSRYRTFPTKPPEIPAMGKILPFPDLGQQRHETEWKSPLEYKEGDTLLAKGAKVRLGEIGVIQKVGKGFEKITPENFMLLLGITTRRAEKKPDDPWHTGDSAEIIFPESEEQKKEQIRELIFSKRELEGEDKAVMRFVEIDENLQTVSGGRKYKLEITSLITAHLNLNNRELFELNIALPEGITREDIFSLWDTGQRINIDEEEVLLLPSLESAPQFQYGTKTLEKLISKAFSYETYMNTEQAIETLQLLIQRNENGNIRPGKIEYEIINGHFYTRDWRGRMIPIFVLFDDAKACREFLEFEQKVVNGPDGQYKFQPSGQTLSAATSNIDPQKLKNPVVNDFVKDGNKVKVNTNAKVGTFYTPPTITLEPPQLLPDPMSIIRNLYISNPYLNRNIFPGTESELFIPTFPRSPDQIRTPAVFSFPPQTESARTLTPAFIFPLVPFTVAHAAEFALPVAAALSTIPSLVAGIEATTLVAATVAVSVPAMVNHIIYVDFPTHFTSVVRPAERITTITTITSNTPDSPNGGSGQDKIENKSQDQQISSPRTSSVNRSATITGNTTTVKNNHNIVSEVTKGNLNVSCDSGATSVQELDQTSPNSAPIKTVKPIVSSQVTNENTNQPALSNDEHPKTFYINNPYKVSSSVEVSKVSEVPQIKPSFSLEMPNILQPNFGAAVNIFPGFLGQKQFFDLFTFPFFPEADVNHEVFKQFFGNLGNYQPAVYAMGMIFIVLLNILSSGMLIA